MKLSEAIRLGSMAIQATQSGDCHIFTFDAEDKPCAACALGAIGYVVGITDIQQIWSATHDSGPLVERWPLLARVIPPPVSSTLGPGRNMARTISLLFEYSRWTREQIADWVQSVEEAERQPVESATPVNAEARSEDEHELSIRAKSF